MNLYDLVLEEFEHRQCAHVDRFPPHYTISIGCHVFNLVNQETEILVGSGIQTDTRLHTMMVAPPGFSKTFWQEQYLREGPWALLEDTSIHHGFEGSTTEAGFVGSADMRDGEAVVTPGLANIYKRGIVGFEEFSALAAMMKSQHSRQLDAALLLALDKGYVVKRLRAGAIRYKTDVTLWSGTQPSRFDLTSGLGRRFYYMLLIPTRKDRELIRDAMWRGFNVKMDKNRTANIRTKIDEMYDQLMMVRKVSINAGVRAFFQKLKLYPYEEPLFIRAIIGYKVVTGDFDKELVIDLDERIRGILVKERIWRKEIMRGPELTECIQILQEFGNRTSLQKFKDEMLAFGVDYRRSAELIKELEGMKVVTVGESSIALRDAWVKKQAKKDEIQQEKEEDLIVGE